MGRNRHKNKLDKEISYNSIGARVDFALIKKKFHEKLKNKSVDNGK
tara:strand:+ start:767 stop:904 length:138 start_codon:yes stop_codon:yes gene_type:complete